LRTAERHGLRLDPTRTHHMDEVTAGGDLVIAVCDHVHETLPAERVRLHWSIPDPVPVNTDDAFEAAYTDLADRIGRLAPTLEEQHP
jgi:protein-tyrosine-phosphatase